MSNFAIVNPAERHRRLLLQRREHFVGEAFVFLRLPADVILRLGRLPADVVGRDVPGFDQVIDDVGIVVDRVDTGSLRDDGEVIERGPGL